MAATQQRFECHMYVGGSGSILPLLPQEPGPRRVINLQPIAYNKLVDPGFRRLLVAFESVARTV